MQVMVTGATGLLGNNLVKHLVSQGYAVRALVRSPTKAQQLLGGLANVELIVGDMTNVSGFAGALSGCDVLFHTAAYFREYYQPGNHASSLEQINVAAAVELFQEAARRGVRRVINTSSAGIVGKKLNGSPGDEETPPGRIAIANQYFQSKVRAEQALNRVATRLGLEVIHILPGLMFGPGDAGPTASGKIVLEFLARQLPGVPDGGGCIVDARDVAAAMVAAAEREIAGARYIVAGEYRSIAGVMALLSTITGVPAPQQKVPYLVMLVVAWVHQTTAWLLGREARLSVIGVRSMHAKLNASSALAKRELGVTFRPLEQTLRDEVAWFRAHGYAPPASSTSNTHSASNRQVRENP